MISEIRQNFTEASASVGLILATALPDGIEQNVLISGWSEVQSNPVNIDTEGARKHFPINGVSI